MIDWSGVFVLVLVAFVGGAFGAAIGALRALALAGIAITVGELVNITREQPLALGGDPATLGAVGITGTVGLGPGLGPHVAFAGGAAAAAFAARGGGVNTGSMYHEAKSVTHALGAKPDVLVVGGAFGVLGIALTQLSASARLPWDPIMFSVLVSALVHRIAFGYPLVGTVRGANVLDMSPFERRGRRQPISGRRPDGSSAEDEARLGVQRYAVEPWLPFLYQWRRVGLLGAVVGVSAAYLTYRTGSPFLAFGLSTAALAFCSLDMTRLSATLDIEHIPVTHHMALPASFAVIGLTGGAATPVGVTAETALPIVLSVGALFGVLCALAGELAQRALYAHADTHLHPPAVAIVFGTFAVAVLDIVGVFDQSLLPTLGF